jgi:hypothetical protein
VYIFLPCFGACVSHKHLSERVLGLDSFETAKRYVNLSVYLHALQRFAEAWLVARRALLLMTVLGGSQHPEIASLHITLSNIAIELRDANGMIHHANEAQKIRVAAYGPDHEVVGEVHQSTAFLYHRIGRNPIAARFCRRPFCKCCQSFARSVFFSARHMQRAATIFEKKFGSDDTRTVESRQLVRAALCIWMRCYEALSCLRLASFWL